MAKFSSIDGKVKFTIADSDVKDFYEALCEIIEDEVDPFDMVLPERRARVGNIVIAGLPENVYYTGGFIIGKHTSKRFTHYDVSWFDLFQLKGMAMANLGIEAE